MLRGRRLELVDDDGTVRVMAGDLPTGGHGIAVLDPAGRPRLWLALEPTGPVIVLTQHGNIVVEAGAHDPVGQVLRPGAYAYLADGDGVPVAIVRSPPTDRDRR